jgi:hypothetical protein
VLFAKTVSHAPIVSNPKNMKYSSQARRLHVSFTRIFTRLFAIFKIRRNHPRPNNLVPLIEQIFIKKQPPPTRHAAPKRTGGGFLQ